MGVGGFAGFGEKRVGVGLAALQIKNENGIVTVSLPQATKEVLDALAAVRAQAAAEVAGRPRHREGEGALRQGLRHGEGSLRQGQARAGEGLRGREDDRQAEPALEKAQEATKDAYEAAKKAMEKPAETPAPATEATPPATTPPPAETAPTRRLPAHDAAARRRPDRHSALKVKEPRFAAGLFVFDDGAERLRRPNTHTVAGPLISSG